MNYETLKERHNIIKEFCKKYRKELTDLSAMLFTELDLGQKEEYIKFESTLSEDEFVGERLTMLCFDEAIDMIAEVLAGEMSFEEFVETFKEG